MPDYEYQPQLKIGSFDTAAKALSSRIPNRVVRSWVHHTNDQVVDAVASSLKVMGFPAQRLVVAQHEYEEFVRRVDYPKLFLGYYTNNLPEKSLEHFLSLQKLDLHPRDTVLDVASEGSPLPYLVWNLYGIECYAQDIMYPVGINGQRIGGDACSMPVPDGFASKVALTCSLEHFELDADTRLWRELAQVVRPKGRVFVIPLYMLTAAVIQTDPRHSASANVTFDPDATIYCAEGWNNRHGRFYCPRSLIGRVIAGRPEFRFTVYRLTEWEKIPGNIYARFALPLNESDRNRKDNPYEINPERSH